MKTWSAGLTTHMSQSTTTLATAWKVVRADGQTFGWTDHDADITIAGVVYRSNEGMQPTATRSSDDFAVDTMDVTAFLDVSTEDEIAAGVWDNAEVTVFECNWASPPAAIGADTNILRHGNLGEITRQQGRFTAEIRGLTQRLSRRIGRTYSPTCPWRHALWNGSAFVSSTECALSLAPYIVSGTVTTAGSDPRLSFTDSGQAVAAGFFNEGLIVMTSGPNAGIVREVRRWENQVMSLYRPFPYDLVVGNTYTGVKGDDKTFGSCQSYGNYKNFGGFPHLPGINAVFTNPTGL